MYASFENVKESGRSVGRRHSCRRFIDKRNPDMHPREYGGRKAAAPQPPHKPPPYGFCRGANQMWVRGVVIERLITTLR